MRSAKPMPRKADLKALFKIADKDSSGTVDFDAAFAALAGGGMEQIPPQLCAPLLRPFATHWGGDQGKALSEAPHDDAAPRKVAALLAASTGGQVQALRQIEQAYRDNTLYSENFKLDSIAEQVLLEYFSDEDHSFRGWID